MSSPYVNRISAGLAGDRPSLGDVSGGPRPFANGAGHRDPGQVRYLGHWPELLADLALLGLVWIETEQAGVRVALRHRLSAFQVQGILGYLDTPEYQARMLLDECYALDFRADERGLAIVDDGAQPLVAIQIESGVHPLPLRLLLSSLGAHGRRVFPVAHQARGSARVAALEHHTSGRLQRDCRSLEPEPGGLGLGFQDLAEISGRRSLNPRLWVQEGAPGGDGAIAVDPSLVPCALETLVDQVHPLALISGSHGWISRSIQQFYSHAYIDGRLCLRGDDARLRLDVRAIDSAWVVGEQRLGIDRRSLRLYDEDGRAMAVIASAAQVSSRGGTPGHHKAESAGFARPGARNFRCRNEAQLWTTLMNALTS